MINDQAILNAISDNPGHCADYYAGFLRVDEIYVRDYVGRMLDAGVLVVTYSASHPYTHFVHAVKVKADPQAQAVEATYEAIKADPRRSDHTYASVLAKKGFSEKRVQAAINELVSVGRVDRLSYNTEAGMADYLKVANT